MSGARHRPPPDATPEARHQPPRAGIPKRGTNRLLQKLALELDVELRLELLAQRRWGKLWASLPAGPARAALGEGPAGVGQEKCAFPTLDPPEAHSS